MFSVTYCFFGASLQYEWQDWSRVQSLTLFYGIKTYPEYCSGLWQSTHAEIKQSNNFHFTQVMDKPRNNTLQDFRKLQDKCWFSVYSLWKGSHFLFIVLVNWLMLKRLLLRVVIDRSVWGFEHEKLHISLFHLRTLDELRCRNVWGSDAKKMESDMWVYSVLFLKHLFLLVN